MESNSELDKRSFCLKFAFHSNIIYGDNKKMKNSMMWLAYGIMWISVSGAVCYGIYVTQNLNALWALIIPLFVSIKSSSD